MEHATSCFPDHAVQETVPILENVAVARDTYRLRFRSPSIARRITPGQFVMVRLAGLNDPLIGRPLALYDTIDSRDGTPEAVDVVYVSGGKFTTRLSDFRAGQWLDVWGPLGNGFPPQETDQLIMVAGGIGQTPFLAVAQEARGLRQYGQPPRQVARTGRVTLCYGARTADVLAGIDDFRQAAVDVLISTDDGTAGERGLVTVVLQRVLEHTEGQDRRIVCCGPEPMMRAVAGIAQRCGVPAQVSLECPMACGIGICFTCVAQVLDESGQADYRRTCIEGPVFDAQRIKWD